MSLLQQVRTRGGGNVINVMIMCSVTELCLGPVLDNDMFSHTDHMEDCDLSVVNAHAVSMSCTASCEQL
jgi:hypothetical protein